MVVGIAIIATAVTSGLVAPPAGAALLVNVTPDSGLVDAQPVDVSASGYTPNAQLAVIECTTGAVSHGDRHRDLQSPGRRLPPGQRDPARGASAAARLRFRRDLV